MKQTDCLDPEMGAKSVSEYELFTAHVKDPQKVGNHWESKKCATAKLEDDLRYITLGKEQSNCNTDRTE